MPFLWLVIIILAIGGVGYVLGRNRALSSAGGDIRGLHSLPSYYGTNVALKAIVPAFLLIVGWLLIQPLIVENAVSGTLPDSAVSENSTRGLVMAEVRRTADGLDNAVALGAMTQALSHNPNADVAEVTQRLKDAVQIVTAAITPPVLRAAQQYRAMNGAGYMIMTAIAFALAALGALWGLRESKADFRARNVVETVIRALLITAASIAVLTTVGIILSLVLNTIEFFRLYPATDFFFGTNWAPSFSGRGGSSDLGVLPLLWGTLYISIVALAVAVPIGLFSAIYLSEYASPRMRAVAKPMIEVLAGIPTIVYGLFALLTVGPLLISVFGKDGLNWMQSGTAVMTAGLVMGIMLIPFVS